MVSLLLHKGCKLQATCLLSCREVYLISALLYFCPLPIHKGTLFPHKFPVLPEDAENLIESFLHRMPALSISHSLLDKTFFERRYVCVCWQNKKLAQLKTLQSDMGHIFKSQILGSSTSARNVCSNWTASPCRALPVAAVATGADEWLCVLELLLHISDEPLALIALEGGQVELRAHFTGASHGAHKGDQSA